MEKSIEMRVAELENLVLHSKNVLSFEEASRFLNLSKSYLYKLTSGNLIPHYKPQGKMLYFEKTELEAWLRQNPIRTQAQTEAGVEKAADKAQVPVSRQQAQDAAQEIRYIYKHDTKPEYTIVTTGGDVEKQAQAAQERAGADFSIVASDDGEKADVASISKDRPVELNQYNVQAYKQVLHTVEVSPDIEGRGIAEVGYSVSRKVSSDGKYLGVGASYNFDNNKAYVKMTYTW